MMAQIKKALLWVARIKSLGWLVGSIFEHASALLPVRRHAETELAICFDHPVPIAKFHLLVIPKRRVPTIFELVSSERKWLDGVLDCAARAVRSSPGAFEVSSNGGCRQDVRQVHFHVLRTSIEPPIASSEPNKVTGNAAHFSIADTKPGFARLNAELAGPTEPEAGERQGMTRLAEGIQFVISEAHETLQNATGFTLSFDLSVPADGPIVWPQRFRISIQK